MNNRIQLLLAAIICFCLLEACATQQVPKDTVPELPPGKALLALVIDSKDKLRNVQFDASHRRGRITLGEVEPGEDIYLLVVDPGEYCFDRLYVYSLRVSAPRDEDGNRLCFKVQSDQLNYGGNIIVRYQGMQWSKNYRDFASRLKRDYPEVFSKYVLESS